MIAAVLLDAVRGGRLPRWNEVCSSGGRDIRCRALNDEEKLLALDVARLDIQEGATRQQIEAAVEGRVLDEAELMGRYERRAR